MLPLLDLDPVPEPASAIGVLAVFGERALQSHQAGMAKQVRPDLALLEIGKEDAVDAPRQKPGEAGFAHRQRQLRRSSPSLTL